MTATLSGTVFLVVSILIQVGGASSTAFADGRGSPIVYTRFDGGQETLVPWTGDHVAVLTPVGTAYSPRIMSKIIDAFDAAWEYYERITGRAPTPYFTYHGLDSIAVVTQTCGAGCSFLGATGSEILRQYFQILYDGVANNHQYDQVMFYEFGRNFWFYGQSLAPNTTYGTPVTTGYAVLMRFRSMNAIGVRGGPYNGTPFPTFESQVWGIAHDYDSDLSKNFGNTLAVDASPSVYGGADFFASIVNLLATRYGGDCFLVRLLSTAAAEPQAQTDIAAVTNFIDAASAAATVDLRPFFYRYWSFPESDGTTLSRTPGGISALPSPVASLRSRSCRSNRGVS